MNVLIVDDDLVALELLKDTLVDYGHEVHCAVDGTEALGVLSRVECEVVVTDWQMPNLDGIGLCKAIRRETAGRYVYVILLTGHNSTTERIEGLSAGADDFMTKPFEPDELVARLQSAERIVSLETRDVTIFSLAKLAESRDPETGAHLERVQGYCRALAQQLAANGKFVNEIDPQFIRLLYGTSPLHDIGKVGIPDNVLLKPGRLSDREFEIMKSHTTIGAETLDAALQRFPKTKYLRMARDIPLHEGELFDRLNAWGRMVSLQEELAQRHAEAVAANAALRAANAKLADLAIRDELTGLANRREALRRLGEQWAIAARYTQPLSCAIIDVDRFKAVNDTHGHRAGDELLKQLAARLRESLRESDGIFRIGGDEFLALLPVAGLDEALAWSRRCQHAVSSRPVHVNDKELTLTVSVGVAQREPEMQVWAEMVEAADQALLESKRADHVDFSNAARLQTQS